jgi:hypothetical protein
MDPSHPKSAGHDIISKQLHNEKLLISNFFAAVSGDKENGFKMVESFGHHLASIIRPINMENLVPGPLSLSFNHGGSSDESSVPSQLTKTSETSNSNLCHSSVREVAIPPLRGKEGDLSLCLNKATDLGYSNVSGIVSDVASVCTNSSDESVPRSAIAIPPLRGKEGGESHIINLVAEGDEFELDRDCSMERSNIEESQGEFKRQRVVDSTSYFENDLNAIKKYLDSESKDSDPDSIIPPEHGE